jgi:hypothetical protein
MNYWHHEYPGRLVDMADYCQMTADAHGFDRGSVFAYEPMWQDGEGKFYPSGRVVVARWLTSCRGILGTFEVLANGELDHEVGHGLPTRAMIALGENGRAEALKELRRLEKEAHDAITERKLARDDRRRSLGRHILKKSPDSRVGRRMTLGVY